MNAYVTLLSSDDYLKAVLILNRNLKELNCQFPLHVIVTEHISDETLEYLDKENIEYTKFPAIYYSQETIDNTPSKRFQSIASKLNIFQLDKFDKVVYIDADSFFTKTIDELFEYPDGALTDCGDTRGFCGLFVCCPMNHPYKYYISLLQNNYMWESDLIEELWFPFKSNQDYRIPQRYFYNITINMDNLYPINRNIYGIHFCCPFKPWMYNSIEEYLYDFNKKYSDYSSVREELIAFYFTHYLEPLKQDYLELFT